MYGVHAWLYSALRAYTALVLLEWTTIYIYIYSLYSSSRTLFVRMCVHVTSNVELRNYVISRHIGIERRVT